MGIIILKRKKMESNRRSLTTSNFKYRLFSSIARARHLCEERNIIGQTIRDTSRPTEVVLFRYAPSHVTLCRDESRRETSRVVSRGRREGRDEERKWENRGMKMGEHRRGVEAGTIYRGREGAVIGSKWIGTNADRHEAGYWLAWYRETKKYSINLVHRY